ncbi:MAG: histidine phosphatase family protein [Acidimicrobiales bacterium]
MTPTTGSVLPGRAPGLHLAEEGASQAEAVAERLGALERVDAVYSSPMERARETARPLARARGLRSRVERGLVTDRTELDLQLHGEFADAGAISAEAQVHATSAAHLRDLLAADHRYVFTLIHKFRLDAKAGETSMPVLSDRSDVIVITDEAHRSQYDTLALNMRRALPGAAFMGFTGTPLIAGEELTRQHFGDYVSICNFRDAIEDGSTVPLFYENRIRAPAHQRRLPRRAHRPARGGRVRRGRRGPARPPLRSGVHAAHPPRAPS